ncbi:MAG: UDP-N-acetylmuramoyl-tripeptide--D-alanyl-D-alanine ligase [Planctomycetes bacterium]|nr:UDP-N-acetylmuramoyl-tripeptide--D-alanyl-D-alanine ligase [Planctomycetota bacterium]
MSKLQVVDIATKLYEGEYRSINIDTRRIRKNDIFLALPGQNVHGNEFIEKALEKGATLVIADSEQKAYKDKRVHYVPQPEEVLNEIAIEMVKISQAKRIGITGSNGKTTTKEMVALVLGSERSVLKTEGNYNNHLGVPLTLCRLKKQHRWAVVEMGTSSPGEIKKLTQLVQPDYCILTSINIAHLEGFEKLTHIAKEKGHIFSAAPKEASCYLFERELRAHESLDKAIGKRPRHFIPLGEESDELKSLNKKSDRVEFKFSGIPFVLHSPAPHNTENALAALSIARNLGVDFQVISDRLSQWKPSEHRMEILQWKKRKIIDDCYNANPTSVVLALKTALSLKQNEKQKVFVAFADMKELGRSSVSQHKELGSLMAKLGVDVLLSLGKDSRSTLKAYDENGGACCHHCENRDDMISFIKIFSKPHDIILIKGSHSMQLDLVVKALVEDKE